MASDWHNWDLNSGRLFPDPVPYALCLPQKPPSMGDPPEIPLQLLLLHQLCHNGAHQHSVHHGSQDEIPEDAHRPEPAGAEKGSEGGCGEGHMPAGLGPDSCPHSGQPLSHLSPLGSLFLRGGTRYLDRNTLKGQREGRGPNRQDGVQVGGREDLSGP